jgi:cytochrome oxidase Cu insertion factor (SCO1/SenC/PrrC family)
MTETTTRAPRTIWIGFLLFFTLVVLAFAYWLTQATRLQPPLRVLSTVADFTLTNQDGQVTTLADLTNHVWVADIIFTRCAGPCPRMTGQMKSLQDKLPADSSVKLVTLTTDPDFDTPTVMKRYGDRFGADFKRWTFLTGTKAQIANLAGDSLKLSTQPIKPADRKDSADLFIHATIFVVVDKHAQMRAYFETGGDNVDWKKSGQAKVLAAVHQLEDEP